MSDIKDNGNIPLEDLFRRFNDASDSTDITREMLINKLASNLPDINPSTEAPRVVEVKIALYKLVDDLLKSKESSSANRIKMQLHRTDTENTANYQEAALAVLATLDPNRIIKGKVDISGPEFAELE